MVYDDGVVGNKRMANSRRTRLNWGAANEMNARPTGRPGGDLTDDGWLGVVTAILYDV